MWSTLHSGYFLSSSSLIFSLVIFNDTASSIVFVSDIVSFHTSVQSFSLVSNSLPKFQPHIFNIINIVILKSVNSSVSNPWEPVCVVCYFCWFLFMWSCLLLCLVISDWVLDIVTADLFVEIIWSLRWCCFPPERIHFYFCPASRASSNLSSPQSSIGNWGYSELSYSHCEGLSASCGPFS